ncbi:hypothetical protein NPIL_180801 [Nephila pilipes]|uniref:Uncharacterized protein n=1 Tax=Nephila pilipes TaxID=299642 RepID=A0A8X6N2Q6_NEPPI|nr:hypothetical protein NPIL_180801 [Nephila pilipes]
MSKHVEIRIFLVITFRESLMETPPKSSMGDTSSADSVFSDLALSVSGKSQEFYLTLFLCSLKCLPTLPGCLSNLVVKRGHKEESGGYSAGRADGRVKSSPSPILIVHKSEEIWALLLYGDWFSRYFLPGVDSEAIGCLPT